MLWSGGIAPKILDLGVVWSFVLNFTRKASLTPGYEFLSYWIGGWVGPTGVLYTVEKIEAHAFNQTSISRSFSQ
jgi:hypothetical protein